VGEYLVELREPGVTPEDVGRERRVKGDIKKRSSEGREAVLGGRGPGVQSGEREVLRLEGGEER